jgi:hypothetical protein
MKKNQMLEDENEVLTEKLKVLQKRFEKLKEESSTGEVKIKDQDFCLIDENQ